MEGPATRFAPAEVASLLESTQVLAAAQPRGNAPGQLIIPGFELSSMVGEGGMSRVYRATQKSLRRQVCVKVMREEFAKDPALAERFQDEGIALAALRHPNIVSVLDVGRTEDGQLFMVMEYVDGGDLRAYLTRMEKLGMRETIRLVSQLLGGLAEAHASGIIHRDLKPSNVLLTSLKDGSTLVKLVDFGIAKLLEGLRRNSGSTRLGTVVGTPGYMAPEQLLGMEVSAATDLYAVGVILFELITGNRPFVARDEFELAQLTMMTPVPHLTQILGAEVPKALDELIIALLAKNPRDRPQSAAAVRLMLDAVQLPVAA
jgi:serine/threonine-protein kinase